MKYRLMTFEDVEFDTDEEFHTYVLSKPPGLYWAIHEWTPVNPTTMRSFLSSVLTYGMRIHHGSRIEQGFQGPQVRSNSGVQLELGLQAARWEARGLLGSINQALYAASAAQDKVRENFLREVYRSTMVQMIAQRLYQPSRTDQLSYELTPDEFDIEKHRDA